MDAAVVEPLDALARFASTARGEVWVHADLPAGAVAERELDRLLGLVVEGAVAVREFQRGRLGNGRREEAEPA